MIMIYSKRAGAQLSHGGAQSPRAYNDALGPAAHGWANRLFQRACEKAPALAQLTRRKWSLGDPLMSRLAACSTSLPVALMVLDFGRVINLTCQT
jgi:hypothetical protein